MRSFSILTIVQVGILASIVSGCPESNKGPAAIVPPSGLAGTANPDASDDGNHFKHPMGKAVVDDKMQRPVVTGKVIEAIYKEAFAYIRLELKDGVSEWAAVVNQKPTVGQMISVQEQAVMKDFHSKSLDRTFDKITFGSVVE